MRGPSSQHCKAGTGDSTQRLSSEEKEMLAENMINTSVQRLNNMTQCLWDPSGIVI